MASTLVYRRLASCPSICQATLIGGSCRREQLVRSLFTSNYLNKNDTEDDIFSTVICSYEKSDVHDGLFMRVHFRPEWPPDLSDFNYFLMDFYRCLCRPKKIGRPYLGQMLVCGAIPDLTTFSRLIKFYCENFAYQHILDTVFMHMKGLGIEPNDSFYKILMPRVCRRFGPIAGYQLLKCLSSSHPLIQTPLLFYGAVVRQFWKTKFIENPTMVLFLIHVLLEMKQLRVYPDEKIFKLLLKGRLGGGEGFLKAGGIARQMFAHGIRIGAVFLTPSPLERDSDQIGVESLVPRMRRVHIYRLKMSKKYESLVPDCSAYLQTFC